MADTFDVEARARRQAQVALRCLGGTAVQLRMPAPPVAGDAGEQLGLRAPEFQTLVLAPVALRRRSARVQVDVPAGVLEDAFGVAGIAAVRAAVATVTSAQAGDELFAVAGVDAVCAGSGACMYRLLLQPHTWEVV